MIRGDTSSRQLSETPAEAAQAAWFPFLSFHGGEMLHFASGDRFGLQVSEKADSFIFKALQLNYLRA